MRKFRQGDVLLIKIDSIPKTAKKKSKEGKKRIELAFGEVTGHAHALYEPDLVEAWGHPENAPEATPDYIEVSEATELHHEEHSTVKLDPGCYEVIIQREWDSVAQASRQVRD